MEALQGAGGEAPAGRGFPVEGFNLKEHIPTVTSYMDRCSALGLAAAKLALEDCGRLVPDSRGGHWGLAYATGWGALDSMELFFAKVAKNPKFAPPLVFSHAYANSPTSIICIEFGLTGVGATFSEGVTGALTALGWARDRLERTDGDENAGFLVCASDALGGALRRHLALEGRAGGEAGAAVTLEAEEAARGRGAAVLATVLGWGSAFGENAAKRAAAAALCEAGSGRGDVAGSWCHCRPESCPTSEAEAVTDRWGECGPAGSLLAVGEVCRDGGGRHLICAEDAAGNAAALVLEGTD
jgi:hypothetical protein